MRRLAFAIRPGWLALHLITIAMVVTMVLLGRWQLTVSEGKGFSIQNFGYALQWWAFSVFVVLMWGRAMRDALRRDQPATAGGTATQPGAAGGASATESSVANSSGTTALTDSSNDRATREAGPEPIARPTQQQPYRRYVMPTQNAPSSDPVHAAYNDYLAQLAAADLADADLTVGDVTSRKPGGSA